MKTVWCVNGNSVQEYEVVSTGPDYFTIVWGDDKKFRFNMPFSSCYFTRREGEYYRLMKILERNKVLEQELRNNNLYANQIRDYLTMGSL